MFLLFLTSRICPLSNPPVHVSRNVPANIMFRLYTSHTPVLKQFYCLSHIITYDKQNVCRESYGVSYCRKCKTLLFSSHAYMSDWSEFKSAETCSNSSFFLNLLSTTSLYYVGNKKYRTWHWYKCILTAFFHTTSMLYRLADEGNAQP